MRAHTKKEHKNATKHIFDNLRYQFILRRLIIFGA